MITLPINLAGIILGVFILLPAVCYLASWEAHRDAVKFYRKDISAREQALQQYALAVRKASDEVADEKFVLHQEREALRELALKERRAQHERELRFARKARDAGVLVNSEINLISEETEIIIPDFPDFSVGDVEIDQTVEMPVVRSES